MKRVAGASPAVATGSVGADWDCCDSEDAIDDEGGGVKERGSKT